MIKRRVFISEEAFKKLNREKLRFILLRRKNPKKFKYKRIDHAYIFDKMIGIR